MKTIIITLSLLSIFTCLIIFTRTEYARTTSPNGQYTAIYTYRTFLASLAMTTGSSSDKPGYVEIIDKNNKSYGELPLPMLQLGAIDWQENSAKIKLIGEWDFSKNKLWQWSADGNSKIQIK